MQRCDMASITNLAYDHFCLCQIIQSSHGKYIAVTVTVIFTKKTLLMYKTRETLVINLIYLLKGLLSWGIP